MLYLEVVKDFHKRGDFVELSTFTKNIKPSGEMYRSYFFYEKGLVDEIKEGKQYGEFNYNFHVKSIVLDIDNKEGFDATVQKTRTIVNRLIKEYDLEDNFLIYFSGRGFHIHLPNIFGFEPSPDIPRIVKATIEAHFPEADSTPIHYRGLIRTPYSLNKKTNLFKIPIRESEIWFLSEQDVMEWASYGRHIDVSIKGDYKLIKGQIVYPLVEEEKPLKLAQPTSVVTCVQHMLNAGPVKGTRHQRVLRIASFLRRQGVPIKYAIKIIHEYVGETSGEWRKIVADTYGKEYAYGCEDTVMKQFCDPQCIFYTKKNYLPKVFDSMSLEEDLRKFVSSDWKKSSINLAEIIDLPVEEWFVVPEDIVTIIGGTGLNKTAFAQNIALRLNNLSPVLYISTEFSNRLLLRRFIQIKFNLSKDEVVEKLREGKKFGDKFNYLKFLNEVPTMLELEDLVKKYHPKVLIIDVVDDIIHKKKGTEDESYVAQKLNTLGKKYHYITFLVHHISKHSAFDEKGNPKRLNVHSGKGSSTFEQKSDLIIGIEGRQDNAIRVVKSLKTRDNPPFTEIFDVDMKTFKFKRRAED